jgi:hypothetical protein
MNTLVLGYASVVFAILKITRPIDSILANKGRQKTRTPYWQAPEQAYPIYLAFKIACLTIRLQL